MNAARARVAAVLATALSIGASPCLAQFFESNSKRLGSSKMDIVIREQERRSRVSVLDVDVRVLGSSVGSSFFVLCSIRTLAQLRGNYRYIVKIEDQPSRGKMLVGFLTSRDEVPDTLGEEFRLRKSPEDVIDLERFAPICDRLR